MKENRLKTAELKAFKALLSQNCIVYLAGFFIVLGMKYFYSRAGSSQLDWILAPTAWWVRILSGIPFEKVTNTGYVNHAYRFIIAPSCSGVQFMIISIAMLVFSFVHQMRTKRRKLFWTVFSIAVSYIFTVFVNGIRIAVSVELPVYLGSVLANQRLSPEKLHTMTGIVIYFAALLVLYSAAETVSRKIYSCGNGSADCSVSYASGCFAPSGASAVPAAFHTVFRRYGAPVFWYISIVLGIPLMTRIYRNEWDGFREFTILTAAVCMSVLLPFFLISLMKKYLENQKEKE